MTPALLPVLSLLLACDGLGKADNAWMPTCESSETDLAWSEASPLGFSGEELILALGSSSSADLLWGAGGSSTLELGTAWSDSVVFVDQWEAEPPDDVDVWLDIAVICDDYLAVQATLGFTSDDGLLADSFSTRLFAESTDSASFSVAAGRADFAHPEIFDPYLDPEATGEGVSIWGELLAEGGTEGSLSFTTEGTDGDTAWASSAEVATWGPELE